jgi:tetratricopeptide (TPR) repeat protein
MKKLITLCLSLSVYHSINAQNDQFIPPDNLFNQEEEVLNEPALKRLADAEEITDMLSASLTEKQCWQAALIYEEVIELGYTDALLYFEKAFCYYGVGKYQQAIADFTKSLELSNDTVDWFYRGSVYQKDSGNYSAIIPIQVKPHHVYKYRGICKHLLGDYRGAIADFKKAISYEPKSADLFDRRADCYVKLENYPAAISDATTAIKLDNKRGMAYITRGSAYYNTEKKEAACLDFSRAGELGNEQAYDLIQQYCK